MLVGKPVPAGTRRQDDPRGAPFGSDPRSKTYSVETLLEQASALCQTGNFPEAEQTLRQILEIEPRHFESLHVLGAVCSQVGNHAEALRHIDAALQVDAQSAVVHNSRGNVLAAL